MRQIHDCIGPKEAKWKRKRRDGRCLETSHVRTEAYTLVLAVYGMAVSVLKRCFYIVCWPLISRGHLLTVLVRETTVALLSGLLDLVAALLLVYTNAIVTYRV
uniref:G_PROTEIN_RECEP_F1_2 domain-containing protein n=1 Tax=Steinernema glaseri TaxID=37863 RepID=A0A1I7YKX2_9BILA